MRYIFEENEKNYELEDKLQEILEEKNIDFDFDDELRLVIPNEKAVEVENIMDEINLKFEIYEGGDYSYERYFLNTNDSNILEELENLLDKNDIDYDYDNGGRIMIPSYKTVEAENIFDKLELDYDLI